MAIDLQSAFARVRAALVRRGRSAQDADDLVQEAWIRLACYERHQVVIKPEAFLMRVALNLSIDAYRAQLHHGEEVMLEDEVLLDGAPSIEAVVLGRERIKRLAVCLGRLSEKTRDIFLAHRLDGLTHQEIARLHGVSASTVEKHIIKASIRLATGMKDW